MRRIDQVKSKKAKNVQFVEFLDKQRLRIVFKNNQEIVLKAYAEDYGYDSGIYIEKDNV
ncbi:hypothetical protein [Paenibacillus illinoisensis]|uniref:Uncharacterized protein n=1 Tax=Paenibacillus illinoisensis TaxID=59845 RepID=A0A2W0C721_9BACL|nr:hypothetical protein [Paenibacillus illinoisensis]PYY28270.1 Uncharacterized protein PIL02S_03416 [Paenibacillus illinoisensis]